MPGQRFGRHYDEAVETAEGETAYTLLIYLGQEDLIGGDTIFYNGEALFPGTGCSVAIADCTLSVASSVHLLAHVCRKGQGGGVRAAAGRARAAAQAWR